jgi:hypothetical protein
MVNKSLQPFGESGGTRAARKSKGRGGGYRVKATAVRWSFGDCPIFKLQSGHTGKFALVCGHKKRVTMARLCGDENIIAPMGVLARSKAARISPASSASAGSKGKTSIGPDRKSTMRCALRSGRTLFAAPYWSSNSTTDDIESVRPSPIAASIPARTGEVRSSTVAVAKGKKGRLRPVFEIN